MNNESYIHPNDDRVLITTSLEDFQSVSQDENFQAAILKRSPEHQSKLSDMFKGVSLRFDIPTGQFYQFCLDVKQSAVYIQSCGQNSIRQTPVNLRLNEEQSLLPKIMADELSSMAKVFNAMTGQESINLKFWKNPALTFHPHNYEVLNFTPHGSGTLWKNESGDILEVDAGDLFYFKPGVEHASPKRNNNLNDLIIVMS